MRKEKPTSDAPTRKRAREKVPVAEAFAERLTSQEGPGNAPLYLDESGRNIRTSLSRGRVRARQPSNQYILYGRNLPFSTIFTRSPFGSSTREISIEKSIALMMPSPNSSWIRDLIVMPYTMISS